MAICYVCDKSEHKYTCPKCDIKYCSLDCFKIHKSSQCEEIQNLQMKTLPFVEDTNPDRISLFDTIDTVPKERLEQLRNSDQLKQLLSNPHLRKFLTDVNSDTRSWKAMKLAMQEPLFLEFADECLKIIEK